MTARHHTCRSAAAAVLALGLASGCAGSRSRITAPHVEYPVSLSPTVRLPDGSLAQPDDLARVGRFKYRYRTRSILWTLIPLSRRTHDLSGPLNEQIRKAGGDAVVNLKVTNAGDEGVMFAAFLLGVLPSSSGIEIEGDIVRRSPAADRVEPAP